MHKLYIELVFLDNFMVNMLIMLLAAKITHLRFKWKRIVPAASIGGFYACAVLLLGTASATLPLKTMAALVMCFLGYYRRGEKRFFITMCAFWAVSFLLAGAIFAGVISLGEPAYKTGIIIMRMPARYILIGLFAGTVLTAILAHIRRSVSEREQGCVELRLRFGGRQITIKAFADTGNLARDPITGCGVLFLSRAAAAELLGKDLKRLLQGRSVMHTDRLRIVPYETAAGQAVSYGIEIDEAALSHEKNGVRAVVCVYRHSMPGFSGIIGSKTLDEMRKGTKNEDALDTETVGMGGDQARTGARSTLYQRQRSTTAAADPQGGRDAAAAAGHR